MSTLDSYKQNTEIIKRFLNQEEQFPLELKNHEKLKGSSIQAYAFIDLNSKFQFQRAWLVYLGSQIAYAYIEQGLWRVQIFQISELSPIKEVEGLSCNQLQFFDLQDEPILTVRFSHRQKKSVHVIEFLVNEKIKKKESPELDKSAECIYTESLVESILKAQSSNAKSKSSVILRLLAYLLPYKGRLTIGVTSAVLLTLVSLLPPYVTGYFIDHSFAPLQKGEITSQKAYDLFAQVMMVLLVIYISREFFVWLRLKSMSVLGEFVAKDLRDEVYSHLHKLSLSFFSSKQTGSLISRVSSDTDRIWDFVAFGVVEVSTSIVMLTGLSVVLISLDTNLGLLVSLPVPFLLWMIFKHGKKMESYFLRAWRKWSNLTDCLSDTIPGIRVVKAFNKENHEVKRFKDRNNEVLKQFNSIHDVWTGFWPILMMMIHVLILSVWYFGVPRVYTGIITPQSESLTPGIFVSFVLYLTMFMQPIEIIGQMSRMINRATSSAFRVFEVIDTEPQIIEEHDAKILASLQGKIEFKNISFSYDGVRKILKNVSFLINPGEMIGLVGPTGSGKSTITNLISRFYDVTHGEILIDDEDLKSLEMASYRNQVGMVLQDPYLFHGSILDNIRYGQPKASPKEVIDAAKAANIHEFITSLPHAYDTVIGERGHTLSGGERQRISIARAILRNPKILILDEATSAVDTETELKIQQALDNLVEGRTVIAIAHRLSTLRQADRIFVVEKGEILEQGSHKELMQIENGTYKKLIQVQTHNL